jgi:hypothetical protein
MNDNINMDNTMQNFLEAVRIISLAGEYLSLTYSTFMPSGQITTGINCP